MIDLSPDYAVESVVGRGGMGTVYRARTAAGAPVAIKVLDHAADDAVSRFSREIRTLAALRHPAVVGYLDHGARAGVHYLVTEWLDGETLAMRLAARDRLPINEVLAMARRIADALAAVHARGIVHRDLKPSNLFLVGGLPAQVKVLDFGVAFVDGPPGAGATRTGTLLGTPAYMAPEQARGERGIDSRADVFSLGCVLYEALSGVAPFHGEHMVGVLGKILFADPAPIDALAPEAPPALCELITRMLAKDRRARPGDGTALREHLDEISASHAAVGGAPRGGFAHSERTLVSVVVAAPRTAADGTAIDPRSLPTVVDARPALARLRAAAASIDVAFEQLAEGAIIATVAGRGHAVDQAAAAARCALAMRAELGPGAIAAATGLGEMSTGALVEVIDRAVELLEPGGDEIRLDATTAGLLDGRFDVRLIPRGFTPSHRASPAGPPPRPADAGPAPRLVLVGKADEVETTRRLLGKPTPFVGRTLELSTLSSAFAASAGNPGARAIVVTGEAGVGKSRLRHELLGRLATADPAPAIWIGRGDPSRAGDPLGILGQAMRRALGVHDGDPAALVRARIEARAGRHFAGDDRARVVLFLAEMIGAGDDDDAHPMLAAARRDRRLGADQCRRAWLDWLRAETAERPLLLVLDDLQWGDATSIAHVDAALAALAERPLCVLALGRPELHDAFPALWRDRVVDRLELPPLGARAAATLAREVLGAGASATLVDRVVAQAAGNAFFLEELLRAVAPGAPATTSATLPPTVVATVHARVDAVPATSRRALRAAAVLGHAAWPAAVAAVLGEALPTATAEALVQLADAELLTRRADSRFPGQPEYTFRNELVAQAAYDGLTGDDRALGHRRAADWLTTAGDRDCFEIAEHWDRSDQPAQSAAWFLRAARAALAQHDLAAASIARAERGAARAVDDATRAHLQLVVAEAASWAGQADRAAAAADDALALLPDGDPALLRALGLAIRGAGMGGAYDRVEALAARAAAIDAGAELGTQARALAAAAGQLLHAGRYAAARALGERLDALAASPRAAALDPGALAELHRARAARARAAGDPWNDAAGYASALDAYRAAGDLRSAISARVSLGFALAELGELERATDELTGALAEAEARGLAAIAARARHNLGLVHYERGELELAWQVEARATDELAAQGMARQEGGARIYLAMIALRRGDLDAAAQAAERACALFSAVPPALAGGLAMRARIAVARGGAAIDTALAATAWACAILDRLGALEEYEALVRLARAEALDAAGRRDEARAVVAAGRDRLLARATSIPTEAGRRRFLDHDADNARIMALATAWEA